MSENAPKRYRTTSNFYRKVDKFVSNQLNISASDPSNTHPPTSSCHENIAEVLDVEEQTQGSSTVVFNTSTDDNTISPEETPSTGNSSVLDGHENAVEVLDVEEQSVQQCTTALSSTTTGTITNSPEETPSTSHSANALDIEELNIRDQIQQWALRFQIPHNALNDLLHILRDSSNTLKHSLPLDCRSLLKTPRTNDIIAIGGGSYWYNGLEKCLKDVLTQIVSKLPSRLILTFNIDGLPIAKSSKNEFWPILCKVDGLDITPLVVAIYFGKGKPPLKLYLDPFVNELKNLHTDGIIIQRKTFQIEIRCFVCDTPARCFIKGTVGFNSYHGCMKCTVIGEFDRIGRHMSFPRTDMPLRTDASFRNRLDPDHHKETSPIEELPINLVEDFTVADALHLLDLGVMKRCLLGWTNGSFNFQTKWSARDIQEVSRKLLELKATTPLEIQQGRLRELDTIHFWKAAEFKNFLLYYGPVVLKEHLSFEVYQHFLTLFCATTICYSDAYKSYRHIAKKLFINYIDKFAEIYGQDSVSSNIHNLCHIVDEVSKFGSLPSLSAYPFESMLFQIKNLLRSGNKPLAQVANRIQELSNINYVNQKHKQLYPVVKHESSLETGEKVFTTIEICKSFLLSRNLRDKWFLSIDNNINEMQFATSVEGEIKISGKILKNKFDFFKRPFNSSYINIYATEISYAVDTLKEYNLNEIKCKLTAMTCNTHMVFIPVLSTLGYSISTN